VGEPRRHHLASHSDETVQICDRQFDDLQRQVFDLLVIPLDAYLTPTTDAGPVRSAARVAEGGRVGGRKPMSGGQAARSRRLPPALTPSGREITSEKYRTSAEMDDR
jgi:hypothetical protein